MTKTKTLIILLFFLSHLSHAQEVKDLMYFQARSSVPKDLAPSIEHVQLHSENRASIRQNIIILDQFLEHLQEQEVLMLGKTELYKAVFRHVQNSRPRLEMYELENLQIIAQAYNESLQHERTHPYTPLLLGGIFNDMKTIMEDPGYRSFLVRLRANPNQLEGDHQIIQRKLEMVLPWLEWYQLGGLDYLNRQLVLALESMIDSLLNRLNDYFYLTRFERITIHPQREGDLTFFRLQARPDLELKDETKKESPPTLEETLAPILDYVPPERLPEPVNDWLPRESAEDFFNIRPDPNYQPPARLPEPVDDWFRRP